MDWLGSCERCKLFREPFLLYHSNCRGGVTVFDLDICTKQTIALLGLAVRDGSGTPEYSTSLGDSSYASEELDRAAQSAATEIIRAIVETDGHGHRYLFTTPTVLTHEGQLPEHYGSIGVPRITPYSGAAYTLVGKRKSVEEISAYRANPNNYYCATDHDQESDNFHSKLAGFYAIEGQTFYFTGFSAVADLAKFIESNYTVLPDAYYPLATALQIANLKKDGDVSDIFTYYAQLATQGLNAIRKGEMDQPSLKKTVGTRDSGAK